MASAQLAKMEMIEIDAASLPTKDLNGHLRDLMLHGTRKVVIRNICGQRYIGTRLYTPEHHKMEIEIFGTPGNDLGAFLFGHKITVHGNAQDGVGNTMDDGDITIEGRAGDVLGFSMRGGKIFVRDSVGYRAALHMKEYENKRPVLVIGGTTQDFLGEYMAGGIVIVLDLHGQQHKGNFLGTGMHGGMIYLRGSIEKTQVGDQVEISHLDEFDHEILDQYVSEFLQHFPMLCQTKKEILESDFIKLSPKSKRPYEKLYAY